MIDKANNKLDGKEIVEWVVWFRTFEGLFRTQKEAADSAERTDLAPEMIRAIPVAIDIHGNYEEAP